MYRMTLDARAQRVVRSLPIDDPPDPLAFLAAPAPPVSPRFYWSAWDDDLVIAASGRAVERIVSGPDRFEEVARTIVDTTLDPIAGGPAWARPKWVGGFGFADRPVVGWDDFAPAWFWVPERMLVTRGTEAWLTIVAEADRIDAAVREGMGAIAAARGGGRPERSAEALRRSADFAIARDAELAPAIERAVAAIRDGRAAKVVFATSHKQRLATAPDAILTLERMLTLQPGCTHFLVSPHIRTALVGATPERLIRVEGDRLEAMALAGTAPRGADPVDDAALGSALTTSAKDHDEHEHVVRAIRAALADCDLRPAGPPDLRRLSTVQHLQTRLVGRRPEGASALDLAARLHPTPALGGWPTQEALRLIDEFEPAGRGWYGGAVGWLDPSGDGDLAVVIRALLLQDDMVTAFAGAGLVAASDPEREAQEIEWKLGAALGAVDAGPPADQPPDQPADTDVHPPRRPPTSTNPTTPTNTSMNSPTRPPARR